MLVRIAIFVLFLISIPSFCLAADGGGLVQCGGSFDLFIRNLGKKSEKSGSNREAIENSIKNTRYLQKVIDLDRSQAAFSLGFVEFSKKFANDYRLFHGRKKIKVYEKIFEKIREKHGVPKEVLTAFWALETDFGLVQGNFHVLSALGTLAFDCRRTALFQKEYLAAIDLVEKKIIDVESSRGAWAGEYGQIQMMPSDILLFGSDGDRDGRVDLTNSPEDTIFTAAAKVSNMGWIPDEPWLEEVIVPENFPWQEAGFERSRSLKSWKTLGVKPRNTEFLAADETVKAIILLPQGRQGPKFLAYSNFHVFLKWNNSLVYSITAAYLANRLQNFPSYKAGNPEPILRKNDIIKLQKFLNELGADVGNIDGILGAKTRQAVRRLQMALKLPADSWPTITLLKLLDL